MKEGELFVMDCDRWIYFALTEVPEGKGEFFGDSRSRTEIDEGDPYVYLRTHPRDPQWIQVLSRHGLGWLLRDRRLQPLAVTASEP